MIPSVFNPPRYQFGGHAEILDSHHAALHLATLSKPISLAGSSLDDRTITVTELPLAETTRLSQLGGSKPPLGSRPQFFDEALPPELNGPILIVGGGQAFRVNRSALRRLATDYWLQPMGAAGGGPPSDPFVRDLKLPDKDREDVVFTFVLGRFEENRAYMPYSLGDAWTIRRYDED